MSDEQEDKLDRILNRLDDHSKDLDLIKSGLYGNEINKQVGLMQQHYELKNEVNKIKTVYQKITWGLSALSTAVTLAWVLVGDWFKTKFGLK